MSGEPNAYAATAPLDYALAISQGARVSIVLPDSLVQAVFARSLDNPDDALDVGALRARFLESRARLLNCKQASVGIAAALNVAVANLHRATAERVGVRADSIDPTMFWDSAAYMRAFSEAKRAAELEHGIKVGQLQAEVKRLQERAAPYEKAKAEYNDALYAYTEAKHKCQRASAVFRALQEWLEDHLR